MFFFSPPPPYGRYDGGYAFLRHSRKYGYANVRRLRPMGDTAAATPFCGTAANTATQTFAASALWAIRRRRDKGLTQKSIVLQNAENACADGFFDISAIKKTPHKARELFFPEINFIAARDRVLHRNRRARRKRRARRAFRIARRARRSISPPFGLDGV